MDIMTADYSAASTIDELYAGLSGAQIKSLYTGNKSFKDTLEKLNAAETKAAFIAQFRALTVLEQQAAHASMSPENRAIIDADYDSFNDLLPQTQTLAPSPDEAAAKNQEEQARALQAEQDRLTAEAAAAGVTPTVPNGSVEELYEGVEKLAEGSYKLTVDPGDGTPVEIFYGTSQKECFKALRKSKASATKELRRRAKKVQISDELRALQVDVVNYPPLLKPLSLTLTEINALTEQLKNPATILEATRKLRQASLSQEECDRQNEETERKRFSDGYNTAISWMQLNPDFPKSRPENIEALRNLMGELNWAVTIKNLNLAYDILKEQGVLLEPLSEETPSQPQVQPAPVVPVTPVAVPVIPVAAPPAPAGALPAVTKVLRPGSSTATLPTRRMDSVSTAPATPVLTVEEYYRTPAAVHKQRMKNQQYVDAFNALIAAGKV